MLGRQLTGSAPIALTGARVALRPVAQDDMATLFAWRGDLLQFNLLAWLKNTATVDEFSRQIGLHLQRSTNFAVADPETDEPIGLVFAYDMNFVDGWCFVLVYANDEHRSQARGREAAFLFWDYLFTNFRLRKIYMDVFEFNRGWVDATPVLQTGLLTEEGRFKGHHAFDGQTWDVIRLALYRERWEQMRDFLLLLVGVDPAANRSGAGTQSEVAEAEPGLSSSKRPSTVPTPRDSNPGDEAGVKQVRWFLAHARDGETDQLVAMLARGAVHEGVISGKNPARKYLQAILHDRDAMASRLDQEQLDRLVDLTWFEPDVRDNKVVVAGASLDGRTMELSWRFNDDGKIAHMATDGPSDLIVSYYLKGVVADWL